jgi:glycosyltransferase involved in cell wall biosynthesis
MTIWIDVEDLYDYARVNSRPSGIQRLSFELYRALVAAQGQEGVRFCRHSRFGQTLIVIPWAELCALYSGLVEEKVEVAPKPSQNPVPSYAPLPPLPPRSALRRMSGRLPGHVRSPLSQARHHLLAGVRFAFQALVALFTREPPVVVPTPQPEVSNVAEEAEQIQVEAPKELDIRALAQPGDILLVLGSPWFRADYGSFVVGLKEATGLRFGLLIYDIIPIIHPEWCDRYLVRLFSEWFVSTVPHVDALFSISEATAVDVTQWAQRHPIALRGPVRPIPIGTGFSETRPATADAALPAGLTPGSYVLLVSTIEARKNHLLAFRIWRRLLAANPPDQVPTLVFAGRVGWLVSDLMQQIANANNLGGKLVVVGELDDATLSALYRGCRFTLFPSLYEGWGLPVSESLGYGKVCLAADRASVPEAGGAFCAYYDPDNLSDATAVVQRALDNPGWIAEMEVKIAAEFKPTPWAKTAQALLLGCEKANGSTQL